MTAGESRDPLRDTTEFPDRNLDELHKRATGEQSSERDLIRQTINAVLIAELQALQAALVGLDHEGEAGAALSDVCDMIDERVAESIADKINLQQRSQAREAAQQQQANEAVVAELTELKRWVLGTDRANGYNLGVRTGQHIDRRIRAYGGSDE